MNSLRERNCSILEERSVLRNADHAPPGNNDKNETSCLEAAVYNHNCVTPTAEESGSRTVTIEAITIDLNTNATDKRKSNIDPLKAEKEKTRRITFILFMVTLVYFISFLPHLALKLVAFMKKDFLLNLNFSEAIAYNTFVWSFFVNSVANSFIYGFYDKKFRGELKSIYCKGRLKLNSNKSISSG
ncbi:hypothetical protein CHS0354_008043 [Potamilus streckersoni]|uniref:G-protein coupled receptors family 1 profile domain-containing protein n=1 Tax=Potamilus streckersoni TaxID=2493646 RepID=A0AAE0SFG0_9BIVA|nr:hypothetical protein CHS0354_008043 [Potamilus streckersoni]